jgi:nucleoside-diphosphate-sugar epimerase
LREKSRIAITGGCGYIGHSLAVALRNTYRVKALDVERPPLLVVQGIEYASCDVTRRDDVEEGLRGADFVIHAPIVQIPLINQRRRLGYEVNIIGTQNVCDVVRDSPSIMGMILLGSWHTIGERELRGTIDEEFGFRPDKVEERARLYALSKMGQESIVRFFDEMSEKIFGVIRMGTVLGDRMPAKTAANIFIDNGLKGKPLTPYRQSMYRPMLYVDISDVCRAFELFVAKVLDGKMVKGTSSLAHVVNVYYPRPVTILELAEIVQKVIVEQAPDKSPRIEVIDTGEAPMFTEDDKDRIKPDIAKARSLLGLVSLKSPEESIREIVRGRLGGI